MTMDLQFPRYDRHREVDEIAGTWDFKWPQGTTIRVAFQQPRDQRFVSRDGLRDTVDEIEKLAMKWVRNGEVSNNVPLDFHFIKDYFFPAAEDERLSRGNEVTLRRRSPSPLPSCDEEYQARDYDILVSLDELPISGTPIVIPASEYGTFARRIDYGVATMHIGPMRRRSGIGESIYSCMSLAEYYENDAFARYSVLHEFGHALGLAHENQNPNFLNALLKANAAASPKAAVRPPNASSPPSDADSLKRLHDVSVAGEEVESIANRRDAARVAEACTLEDRKILAAQISRLEEQRKRIESADPIRATYLAQGIKRLEGRRKRLESALSPSRSTAARQASRAVAPPPASQQLAQNTRAALKRMRARLARASQKMGVEPLPSAEDLDEFIIRYIAGVWPGNPAFSDWRDYDATAERNPKNMDSVMFVPYFEYIVGLGKKYRSGTKKVGNGTEEVPACPDPDKEDQVVRGKAWDGPSERDRKHLRSMYE